MCAETVDMAILVGIPRLPRSWTKGTTTNCSSLRSYRTELIVVKWYFEEKISGGSIIMHLIMYWSFSYLEFQWLAVLISFPLLLFTVCFLWCCKSDNGKRAKWHKRYSKDKPCEQEFNRFFKRPKPTRNNIRDNAERTDLLQKKYCTILKFYALGTSYWTYWSAKWICSRRSSICLSLSFTFTSRDLRFIWKLEGKDIL